ncbi:MAG: excinuclease ABC subunit UvrC [Chloroflexi bacterium]|jgi:excinuclease ABC subunit C|nr:excinuclease ABC subunit UvrC [Chloroflexota bacterium]
MNEKIEARLAGLPTKPGVYIMRDAKGHVIYVGKAIVLRNRVRSYFQDSASHTPKTRRLVAEVADLEWIVTESELEALILECELIKRYRPHFNVRLKDDKRYPYIKITMQEDFPRILIVRRMLRDGARYFGPFTSSQAVYQSLELLRKLFPYRTCNREITGEDKRACLYYHIKRCPGPCIGKASKEEYRAIMEQAALFLEGKQEQIIEQLQRDMEKAAEELQFERAATLRDQSAAISQIIERQRIVSAQLNDHDVVALARDDGQACVQVFFIRGGKLIGREYFVLDNTHDESASEVVGSFLKQFYDEAAYVPPEVLVQEDLDEMAVIQEWLRRKRGTKVTMEVPRHGEKEGIMRMAVENATETLARLRAEWEADTTKHVQALTEIQQALGLPEPPTRIECYDISNTQGTNAVGSMVVFTQGAPSKQDYRRFRVRTVEGPDDFASMGEVLRRRFQHARDAKDQRAVDGKENRWAIMPDLVIVDGGKGQLGAAMEAMRETGVQDIPVAGLAKENEEIFLPHRSRPVILPRNSEGLYLLQRIRDEAHRFAITYHRNLRGKESVQSILDDIPGIGPRRRSALLKAFGSVDAIRQATVEQLAEVPGMNRTLAEAVLRYL